MRVRIDAGDVERAASLAKLVREAGHEVVLDAPDVVLADAGSATAMTAGIPAVVVGAPEDGVAGVVPEPAGASLLDAVLRVVAAGLTVRPAAEPNGFASADEAVPVLTAREAEVLAAVGAGLSNKEVARRLGISAHTVKFHLEQAFRKLGAGSRAEAVAKGLRRGAIEV